MESALSQDPDMQTALSSLLELAGLPSEGPPTAKAVQSAVDQLKTRLANSKPGSSIHTLLSKTGYQNVLIAGQLGIVLHQIRQSLTKLGAEITLTKDMESAIEACHKQEFQLAIIDLFMPSEREGMIVLNEIKRMPAAQPPEIIILSPPCKDQSLQDTCLNQGANYFLEKIDGWHETLLAVYQGEPPADLPKR